jgi:hypothetical protein
VGIESMQALHNQLLLKYNNKTLSRPSPVQVGQWWLL